VLGCSAASSLQTSYLAERGRKRTETRVALDFSRESLYKVVLAFQRAAVLEELILSPANL
jgi:hypothetical protein